jgi:LacI family transcriptional regulator
MIRASDTYYKQRKNGVSLSDDLKKRPTQSDVANRAGVSQTTVSYVINNSDIAIPEATRRRVLMAMEELGYVPNRAARSLRSNKTFTIATIIPDIANPFYPAYQRGIQDVTRQYDYDLILYNTDEQEREELRCLRSLEERQVDGAIVALFHHDHQVLRPLLDRGVALVSLVTGPQDVGDLSLDTIYVDNSAAAYEAVCYLANKGHARIGMIAGSAGTPARQRRVHGYQLALSSHHLPHDETIIQGGEFTEQGGYESMKRLLNTSPRITAVFASNDLMAIGAMAAIRQSGLSVPEDIAVVGFDDIPAARLISPPLTTINQFKQQLGRRAAELLFERLSGAVTGEGRSIEMPFELIIRQSA